MWRYVAMTLRPSWAAAARTSSGILLPLPSLHAPAFLRSALAKSHKSMLQRSQAATLAPLRMVAGQHFATDHRSQESTSQDLPGPPRTSHEFSFGSEIRVVPVAPSGSSLGRSSFCSFGSVFLLPSGPCQLDWWPIFQSHESFHWKSCKYGVPELWIAGVQIRRQRWNFDEFNDFLKRKFLRFAMFSSARSESSMRLAVCCERRAAFNMAMSTEAACERSKTTERL